MRGFRTTANLGALILLPALSSKTAEIAGRAANVKPALGAAPNGNSINTGQTDWWLMNEGGGTTVANLVTTARGGTFAGSPTWATLGGNPVVSVANSAYISLANAGNAVRAGSVTAYTIFTRFQVSSLSKNRCIWAVANDAEIYLIANSNGLIRSQAGGAEASSAAGVIVINTLYNAIVTHDGATQKIYVGGTQVASNSTSFSTIPSNTAINFGEYRTGALGVLEFNGYLDSMRIWNRVLSAGEIATLTSDAYAGI